jgi:sugar phosphate isomerase/epimerase
VQVAGVEWEERRFFFRVAPRDGRGRIATMSPLPRRQFLRIGAASLLAAPFARAIEPFARPGAPRLQLALAAYSFRDSFTEMRGKKNPAGKLTIPAFLDYCAEQNVGAELTSYFFPQDASEDYLREVRRHAFLRGVAITGTAVGNTFALPPGPELQKEIADVKRWIDHAAVLGAPHIRIFAGSAKGVTEEEARKSCIAALEECCAYAGTKGIFLGLENHGGIVSRADQLLAIVRVVKSPWLGINLDSGNFHSADPYTEFAQCAPYAVNAQIKAEIKPAGAKEHQPADLARFVQILRDANYQGWVALEYEAKPDPWTQVPLVLAQLREELAKPAKPADAGWTPLFDGKTLEGWKSIDFGGHGDVTVEDGKILLGQGDVLTGIRAMREMPKMNYEVQLEAMRVDGTDFFCALTFPYGETHATFVVGGWGGGIVGLSSINGDDASENETTQIRKFEPKRWYRVRLRATPEKIEAWIDDEQMVNVATQGKKISMRAGEIEESLPFGIASFRTHAALRGIKLRKL